MPHKYWSFLWLSLLYLGLLPATYPLLMSTQKQLLGIKKEPLIFIIRNSFSFTHFLKYNLYFIILHIIHFFRSYVFHYL